MKQISYDECLERMYGLGRFGIKLGLDTISEILTNLGSPEKKSKASILPEPMAKVPLHPTLLPS